MVSDLTQIRASLANDQRCILDRIWNVYYGDNGNTWPDIQDLQIRFEKPLVLAALAALPPGTIYEENEQYRIGLLGVLLTTTGIELEKLLADYLDYVRSQKKNDLTLKFIKSRDVAAALKLSEEETMILGSMIHLGQLGGDRGAGGPTWTAGIPRDLADLMPMSRADLGAFVRDRATEMAEDLAAARAPASGHLVSLGISHLRAIAIEFHASNLVQQIETIEDTVDVNPRLAIGTAKELVETTCKTILSERGVASDHKWNLGQLTKRAREELQLTPDDIANKVKAGETVKRLLGNLANVVQGLAELRNPYGTGHGPDGRARGLQPRHARLAAGAAATLATFLFETHKARQPTDRPSSA